MFNVTKALKRLEEYVKKHTIKEYPHCIVSTDILREILLAGQDDEFDLLEFQRGSFSGHKDAMKDIEERLARQDERMDALFNHLARIDFQIQQKEPSKPTEEHNCKECGTTLVSGGAVGYYCPNDDCPCCWDVFKPKKPMPSKEDEVTQYERERMRIMDENCNPEKPVTEEKPTFLTGQCHVCGDPNESGHNWLKCEPRDDAQIECQHEWNCYHVLAKKDPLTIMCKKCGAEKQDEQGEHHADCCKKVTDLGEKRICEKPSEFISIPRDVADKYIRYVEAKDAPEAIKYYRSRQDVIDAIKQQLG
jgi:hypothetical protein